MAEGLLGTDIAPSRDAGYTDQVGWPECISGNLDSQISLLGKKLLFK
jgi:hypothetical protein